MDCYEATRIVFSRIQISDPENASKIMGLLLLQDHSEKEMIRLAFGPEPLLQSVVVKARKDLGLVNGTPRSSWCDNFLAQDELISPKNGGSVLKTSSFQFHANGMSSEDLMEDFQLQDRFVNKNESYPTGNLVGSVNGMSKGSAADGLSYGDTDLGFGWTSCQYFSRGFCKNGGSCRFLHGGGGDPSTADLGTIVFNPGKLETMSTCHNLIRSKTADQRSRLTQQVLDGSCFPYSPKAMNLLLRRQQNETQRAAALMMGEDLSKLSKISAMSSPASRQIYLTFPADCSFREEDVSNYFSTYGPVQDVRIPYQQKRMFGFVTFVYAETVKMILTKGNPHFVCDSRVLVKPYKEKGKFPDKFRSNQFVECGSPNLLDSRDPLDFQSGARMIYNNRESLLRRRKLEEQEIELQSRRLTNLHLLDMKMQNNNNSPNLFNQSNVESPHLDNYSSPLPEFSVKGSSDLTKSTVNDEKVFNANKINLPQSTEHNLPDSPFASPVDDFFVFDDSGDVGSSKTSTSTSSSSSFSSSEGDMSASTLDMGSFRFNCQMPGSRLDRDL